MRKVLSIFIILFSLVFLFLQVNIYKTKYTDDIIYLDSSMLSVLREKDISENHAENLMINLSKKYNVNIYKIYDVNPKNKIICATDTSFKDKVILNSGNHPKLGTEEYISNSKRSEDNNKTGNFYLYDDSLSLSIYPISYLKSMGSFYGIIHIGSSDMSIIRKIADELNSNVGSTEILSVNEDISILNYFYDLFQSSKVIRLSMIMIAVLFTFISVQYIISISREISILRINGYNTSDITASEVKDSSVSFIFSIMFSTMAILSLIKGRSIPYFIMVNISLHLMLFLYMMFIFIFTNMVLKYMYRVTHMIKGKKPFFALMSASMILKYALLVVIILTTTSIKSNIDMLEREKDKSSVWNLAHNVYSIQANYATNDLKKKRIIETDSKSAFKELEKEKNAFVISAQNYDRLLDGSYLYERNTQDGTDRYSIDGTSIIVNPNYIKIHPIKIYNMSNSNVLDKIVYEDRTINILVPISLKKYESYIKKNYQRDFYYRKVEVGNEYRKLYNKPLDQTSIDDLSVNIIYIADNLEYFTYDSNIEPDKQNIIADPIVVVDIGNFDDSYYFSYMTYCTYFKSFKSHPYKELVSISSKNNVENVFNSVYPVYSMRSDYINNLEKEIKSLIVFAITMFLCFLISVIMFGMCYYERYKYEMHIKRVFGYSLFRINLRQFVLNSILTLLVILLSGEYSVLGVSIFILDLMIVFLSNIIIFKSRFQRISKGGH